MLNISDNLKSANSVKQSLNKNKNVLVTCADTARYILLSYLSDRPGVILLLCENSDMADKVYDSLSHFGIEEDKIFYFPSTENFSYKDVRPDYALIGERLSTLNKIMSGEDCIVVAPVQSVCTALMSPDVLAKNIITLKPNDEMEIDSFEKRLIGLGYTKGEVCDHRGIYSRRGSLIDIFPSNEEYPVRINLDWDEITEIKYFDTDTQRTTQKLDYIQILPARELLYTDDNLLENITKACKEEIGKGGEYVDKLRENTENFIEKIKEKIFFDSMEYFLPYSNPKSCLWDYLPKNTLVVFNNPQGIEKAFGDFCEQQLSIQKENKRKGILHHSEYSFCDMRENFLTLFAQKFLSLGFCSLEPASGVFSKITADFSFTREEIPSLNTDTYAGRFNELISYLGNLPKGERVVFATASAFRMEQILREYDIESIIIDNDISVMDLESRICVVHAPIIGGVYYPTLKLRIFTDAEVFGIKRGKKVRRLMNDTQAVKSYLDLKKGDYVVHEDYGVCRYNGVDHKQVLGAWNDFLVLEFANKTLFVSTNGLDRVQKYVGGDGLPPKLSKLGGSDWERIKTRAKKKIWEIAKELVDLYAYRQSVKGYVYEEDTKWQQEMEKSFPYKETKTQLAAINDIKRDLESDRPMDRLICGDVGYGKTEVAIRAAFKVALAGRQVAVLAPTTVLSEQHYMSFKERLSAFPQKIELLNRFRTSKEIKEAIENIKNGKSDIIIGTHRILSKDVTFANLGLIIIDEEQRFGVKHKEKLKELKKNVDVLSLSATPIPRTLNMSLSGIREISLITDAPEGRVPIKTYVKPYNEILIKNAIIEELSRGGQVFFIHNRVEDIYRVADKLEQLVPNAYVDVAHGQMNEKTLEECMMDFYKGKVQVLVATTIIENGIDVSNANTIIIDHADKLGLSQLYQLRGRVGRSGRQAFAYLLYRGAVTVEGEERLKALREFSDLGSGFRIAEKDLEIRGAGNLLGKEQSGNIEGIGFEYYCNLLNQAVAEMKGKPVETVELPPVDFVVDTYIPEDYIEVESLRIMFYKKLSQVKEINSLNNIESEIEDRFGPMPQSCKNMINILKIRILALANNIASIGKFENKFVMVFGKGFTVNSEGIKKINKKYSDIQVAYDRLFYYSLEDIIEDTLAVFEELPKIYEIARKETKRML